VRARSRSNLRVGIVAILLALAVPVVASPPASAHASLRSTDPVQGASLEDLPDVATLTFSEPLLPVASAVLVGPDGATVPSGPPEFSGESMSVPLEDDAGPGQYALAFRATSEDGHVIADRIEFAVGEAFSGAVAAPVGADAPAADETDAGTRSSAVPEATSASGLLSRDIMVPGLLFVLALGAWWASRRPLVPGAGHDG
jgi:methionine-rich copper-binding protein CopC